jgi:uncharacterized membrane protein
MMLVVLFGLAGVAVSAYVWYKQVTPGAVLCVGDGCAKVIRSPYGRLLGIPNGALGVGYFAAAALIPLVARPGSMLWSAVVTASVIALVLYGYLIYLQAAVLRAWCVWCLGSAALTAAILAALRHAQA